MDAVDRADMHPRQKFRAACIAGRLEEAKALVAEHGLDVDDDFERAVVCAAGVHGHLPIGQWAVAEHGMDLHGWPVMRIFVFACEFGHLHVCQWLTEYGFEPHDWVVHVGDMHIRIMDRGFDFAVARRQWPIALWLVQRRPEHSWPDNALFELFVHEVRSGRGIPVVGMRRKWQLQFQ